VLLEHSLLRSRRIQTVGLNIWPPGLMNRVRRLNNGIDSSNAVKEKNTQKLKQHINNISTSVENSEHNYSLKSPI
jgi:hypothetical protein